MQLASEFVFLADIVNSSDDAIVSKGIDSVILTWNPTAVKMFGFTQEEAIGKNITIIIPPHLHSEETKIITKILRGEPVRHYETQRMRKDGKLIDVSISISPIRDISGNIIGASKIARDITERKRIEEQLRLSEATYRTIASSIPSSVICIFDLDYRYILIEGDMLEKFGYSRKHLLGQKAQDVLSPERFEKLLPDFTRVLKGETFMKEEKRGDYYTVDRYVPMKNDDGIIYAFMIAVIDMTQQKRNEMAVKELNDELETRVFKRTLELENSNKELEAFCYSISHDLRTPLRAINGFSQILSEEYSTSLPDAGKRVVKVITTNANRLGLMIDELLNFSKIGKNHIRKHLVNINSLVDDVLGDLRNVGTDIPAGLIVNDLGTAQCDYALMKSVWTNLISNALKYSRVKSSPEISIGRQEVDNAQAYYIKDNGAGFNMDFAEKLFGVFHRLHREDEFEGIGVGLAIVKRIVEKHGGKVWAVGKKNEGAQFYFTLPTLN